jgi:hypothetical protein
MPAHHIDSRIAPFLLRLKDVRKQLHNLRMDIRRLDFAELRPSIDTLLEVLNLYSCHLKYLRRYTLVVLLVPSSVAEELSSSKQSVTCFLDLDVGLSDKELTITLEHCPSLSNLEICSFVDQTYSTLDLILRSLYYLSDCFKVVSTELKKENSERSPFLVRKLGEAICYLNLSRYTFDLGVRENLNRLLFNANKHHLRIREHLLINQINVHRPLKHQDR